MDLDTRHFVSTFVIWTVNVHGRGVAFNEFELKQILCVHFPSYEVIHVAGESLLQDISPSLIF